MSYPIEIKIMSKNGWMTPAEARAYYGRYDRHGITWHWWGLPNLNPDSAHDNIYNYIAGNAVRGQSSVNYVLSNRKITLGVGPDNVAWTSQSGNPVTVSVELSPNLDGEGYKKAGWLASEIASRYGGDRRYYRHSDWNQTQCPGTISLDRIRQEEDKWQRGDYNKPTPPPPPTWNFVAEKGKAKVTGTGGDGLYVLKSPQLSGQAVTVVNEGTMMDYVGYVTNGDSVNGNKKWWKNAYGNYFSSAYAPKYVAPAPTPEPTPKPPPTPVPVGPVILPVKLTTMYTLNNAKLVNIENMAVISPPSPFALDTPVEIMAETTWQGNKFYLTKWAYENKKNQGFLVGDLKPNKTPAPVEPTPDPSPTPKPDPEKPEWVTNLRDLDDTKYWFKEDTKLIDITTGKPFLDKDGKEVVFAKDDEFVSSALTFVGKQEWRITDYSFKKGIFNGVPIGSLTLTPPGVPDIDPIPDNPGYIDKNVVILFLESIVKLITDFIGSLRKK